MRRRGGGGGEELSVLEADNSSCHPKAEVETTPHGFFFPIFVYIVF